MKKLSVFWLILFVGLSVMNVSMACDNCSRQETATLDKSSVIEPDVLLKRAVGHLVKYLQTHPNADKTMISAYLEQYVSGYFDFSYMSTWILGQAYREMDMLQKARTDVKLKRLVLATLTRHLARFGQQRFTFLPARKTGQNEVRLTMLIENAGRYPNKIDFRFYQSRDGWKVFDITANTSSMLVYYRQLFKRHKKANSEALP